MTTPTTNFSWGKPVVGADSNSWGGELNTIFDSQDATLGALLSATGNLVTPGGSNVSHAAWTTTGLRATFKGATYTDTTSSGTVPAVYVDAHKAPVIAAQNVGVTFTNAYTVYCENPVAGSNVTLGNAWALGADSLKVNGPVSLSDVTTLGIRDTSAAFDVTVGATSSVTLTAGRSITVDVANASRTLKMTGNAVLNQDVSTAGSPTFAGMTSTNGLNVTGSIGATAGFLDSGNGKVLAGSTAGNVNAGSTANLLTFNAGQAQRVHAWNAGASGTYAIADVMYDGATLTIANLTTAGSVTLQASGAILQVKNNTAGTVSFSWAAS